LVEEGARPDRTRLADANIPLKQVMEPAEIA
jgi:hypothetical protein